MKHEFKYILYLPSLRCPLLVLFLAFFLQGCVGDANIYKDVNRWEIYRTLAYYKYIKRDTLKYAASKYLIENMKYHFSNVRIYRENATLERWLNETDSLYYSLVRGLTISNYPWDTLWHVQKEHRKLIESEGLPNVIVDYERKCDLSGLTFDFLTKHINNAFKVWKESIFAKDLTFDEFKEYILPYRCIEGYGFHITGQRYYDLFSKYITAYTSEDISSMVKYYNTTIINLRGMNGKTHRSNIAGIYDLYSSDFHDCVDMANYGCNILRACGLPVVVEYCICYRSLPGRHFHCSVYNDSIGEWQPFNAEYSIPGEGKWAYAETANIYRMTYGIQKNTPYFMKANDEYVPIELNNPCVKDVTSYLLPTFTVTLPLKEKLNNNLAYLATFHKNSIGIIPVTWGSIDKINAEVTFKNVISDLLYFPVYYIGNDYKTFGNPFYIDIQNGKPVRREILDKNYNLAERSKITLTRKYPRKPNMKRVAEEMVGGRFIGANKRDFSDAITLLEIKETPVPALITYPLEKTGKFKYYRFQTTKEHPHAHISMLEWLAPDSLGYKNTMLPYRNHVLSPEDTSILNCQTHFVRLMESETWNKMAWKAEYDGNMQTSPSGYPNITLPLKEPQKVTHVRFSPKNADNGIRAGDKYELYYWHDGWHSCGTTIAEFEFVVFENVPHGQLYWLENKTRGREEMPFILDKDGKQKFLYYDLLDITD